MRASTRGPGPTRRNVTFGAAALAAGLAAPSLVRAAEEKLILGASTGNSIYWDLDVAMEKGFFKAEGFAPETIIPPSSPQAVQMLLTGAIHLAATQPEPFIAAIEKGAAGLAALAAPMNRADWTLNVRPDVKTLADLKGKVIGVSALKNSECWQTTQLLDKAGLKPGDFTFVVSGLSPTKITALEKGSISAAVLFQPSGFLAESLGLKPLAFYYDLRTYPSILYAVSKEWAGRNETGRRASRAIGRAHAWLYDPANRDEAIAILAKYTKRDPAILGKVYDLYFTAQKIYSPTGATQVSGLERAIADMVSDGEVIRAPVPAQKFLLVKDVGGLWE